MLWKRNRKEVRMMKDQHEETYEEHSKHEREMLNEMKYYADLQLGIFKALMDYVTSLEQEIKELKEKNELNRKQE